MRRAKVIWIKLQLKRNFPMTFREALYPWAIDGNPPSATAAPQIYPIYPPLPVGSGLGTGVVSPIPPADLPPHDAFVKAIQNVPGAQIAPPGSYSPDESAHLLYIAMTVSRRGTTFDPEGQLGPSAIYQDPAAQGGLLGLKDAWDQPLAFFRWPTDYVTSGGKNTLNPPPVLIDADDPEFTLQNSAWQGSYGAIFQQLCHTLPSAANPLYPPTIVSGGLNKRLGLLLQGTGPSPNFGMAVSVPPDEYDNIYSYAIK